MPPKGVKKAKDKLANKPKFEVGEKVLCFQNFHLYEAKCLEMVQEKQEFKYKVHYKNWKSRYDEWVSEDRLRKYNEQNLKHMRELREKGIKKVKESTSKSSSDVRKESEKKEKKIAKSNSSESTASSLGNTAFSAPKKLTTPAYVCKQEDFLNMQEVKIRIPEDLKPILVDDWELIVNQNKELPLPPKYNIDRILHDYLVNKTQSSKLPLNHTIEGYENFIGNLKKYFNRLIEKDLLYIPMEREQFNDLKKNYDKYTRDLNRNERLMLHKESRRKHKKSRKHQVPKLPVPSVTSESSSNSNCPPKTPTLSSIDNNSQSEISDSSENTTGKEQLEVRAHEKEEAATSSETATEIATEVDYTKLYGVVHLLRLFTKLGHLLFFTDLNEERLALLNTYVYDFLKYLSKNLWLIWNCTDASYIDRKSAFTAVIRNIEQ